MPKVPNLNIPNKDFGKWKPDKQEVNNMKYWKAKKPVSTKSFFVCSVCKHDCLTRKALKEHWDMEH